MLPLRKEFILDLKVGDSNYELKYLEATAEEAGYFYDKIKTTGDFVKWLSKFLDKQDSLNKSARKKIMMFIYEDVEKNITTLYNKIVSTMFRSYKSKYIGRKLPKEKGQGESVSCDAATELHLAQKTLIPVHELNKKLTLYQKQWLLDGIICDNWNSTKKGQGANRAAWADERSKDAEHYRGTQEYKDKKARMDKFKAALDNYDKQKKDGTRDNSD